MKVKIRVCLTLALVAEDGEVHYVGPQFPVPLPDRRFCVPQNTCASGNEDRKYCNCGESNTYLSDRSHSFYWLTILIHYVTQLHIRKEVDKAKFHWNIMAV